jgi:hypothetical protein
MTTNEYQVPDIPQTHHRYAMTPEERVSSFAFMAKRVLEQLPLSATDERMGIVCLSLAAAYVEGAQDGRSHGYADGFVSGKGGPTP